MVRNALLFALVVTASGAAHGADPVKPAADTDKVVCKRQTVTGSLAQSNRVCHTREGWQLLGEQNREEGRRLQDLSTRQGTHD